MFFLNDFKKREINVTLPTLLAGILFFSLVGWLTSTTTVVVVVTGATTTTMIAKDVYAEEVIAGNNENFSSIVTSFNTYSEKTIKKNETQIIDFDDRSDKIRERGSELNFNNTFVSENQFKNETGFPFNITDVIGNSSNIAGIGGGSSDAAGRGASEVTADFNGDGFEDKAIGVPDEDIDGNNETVENAGAVHVIYGTHLGLSASANAFVPDQLWSQKNLRGTIEEFDNFGYSLSSGDYNGDGHDDLAIGVPRENIDFAVATLEDFDVNINSALVVDRAGVVHIIYGSPVGLSINVTTAVRSEQIFFQGLPSLHADVAERADFFGLSLSSGDYNNDTRDDLAVGVPNEDVNTEHAGLVRDAGAVHVIYGSAEGLSTSPMSQKDQLWTQTSTDIEKEDYFGQSLSSGDYNGDGAGDLAIGIGNEDVGTVFDAGEVNVIYGSPIGLSSTTAMPIQVWTQKSQDIADSPETGDFFGGSLSSGDYNGDGRDDLAIGVLSESRADNTIIFVGKVHVIYGSPSGLSATSPIDNQLWMQGDDGIDEVGEARDYFGWSLSSGDYNGDGRDDLAIGVPFESIEQETLQIRSAGKVHVIYGSPSGLSATSPIADQLFIQGIDGVNGASSDDDLFGWSLSSGDYNGDGHDDLAIGIPQEDVGGISDAGAVDVLHGSPSGLSATSPIADKFFIQGAGGLTDIFESHDWFGLTL